MGTEQLKVDLRRWLPPKIIETFEIFNYNHAAEILSQSFSKELADVVYALTSLKISEADLLQAGGNESPIPPKFAAVLEPKGWKEIRISGDLLIKFFPRKGVRRGVFAESPCDQKTITNYIDGHNEWNSKDQTFDRDLFAMRTYYECDIISVGIIITRSESLNEIFKKLGIMPKYGASTTWMGKLLPRLDSRRHGGCPILAIGITPKCITGGKNEK